MRGLLIRSRLPAPASAASRFSSDRASGWWCAQSLRARLRSWIPCSAGKYREFARKAGSLGHSCSHKSLILQMFSTQIPTAANREKYLLNGDHFRINRDPATASREPKHLGHAWRLTCSKMSRLIEATAAGPRRVHETPRQINVPTQDI